MLTSHDHEHILVSSDHMASASIQRRPINSRLAPRQRVKVKNPQLVLERLALLLVGLTPVQKPLHLHHNFCHCNHDA